MEDDEEIMSHHSGDTESPPSLSPPLPSRSIGRIAVTVASAPPQPSQNVLTLALPVEQPRSAGSGGGREDCWSEGATGVLIDAWGERYMELSRGNLKQKHWKEVADIVSSRDDYMKTPKTDIQCKNRIDTVKKKYKTEKQKIAAGCGPSRWPFFQRLDELIGPTAKINNGVVSGRGGATISPVTVGISGSKNVPMGIPVGIRPMPIATIPPIPPIPQFRQPVNFQSQLKSILYPNPYSNTNTNTYPNPKPQYKRKAPMADSDTDESEPEQEYSRDSSDGFPPEPKRESFDANGARGVRNGNGGGNGNGNGKSWGNSVRELTRAILSFGESYERAESSKLEQLIEMEKERMRFAKEMELQRIQFFMKTQMDVLQGKKHRRVENNNSDSSS